MAHILPLRALRFAGRNNHPLSKVLAPPYDVIQPKQKKELLKADPFNVIRLIIGNPSVEIHRPADYRAAARSLKDWRSRGVLRRDDRPSVTVYQQTFRVGKRSYKRTGFLALDQLTPFGNTRGGILPHERTLAGPKADRLNLMKACHANFSPIFSLYSDRFGVNRLLKVVTTRKPDTVASFPSGIVNRVWKVSDPGWIRDLQKKMGQATLFIADGHHRYETALAYQAWRSKTAKGRMGSRPFDHVLMMFVAMEDPGLVILPTHRMLSSRTVGDPYETLVRLTSLGRVFEYPARLDGERPWETMQRMGKTAPTLGFSIDGRKLFFLQFSKRALKSPLLAGLSRTQKRLDVAILHRLILEPWFGIAPEKVEHEISFTSKARDAVERLRRNEFACTFFLNPTRIEQLRDVAIRGERMPQKSTFFYPKLITGLVFNDLTSF